MTVSVQAQAPHPGIPWVSERERRRAKRLYDIAWVRNRNGGPWPLPDGTETAPIATPLGDVHLHQVGDGDPVLLVHPDRRYGGHWFVKEGWVDELVRAGRRVAWFDQPGYGQGTGGSPYLAENVLAARAALDGPVDVIGVSLGAFATSIAAPYLDARRIVLESVYSDFGSWYDNHGWSLGKFAAKTFGRMFPHADKLRAGTALAEALGNGNLSILASLSEVDTITPPGLTRAALDGLPVEWYASKDAPHLGLWTEPEYRERVIEFLA